MFSVELETGELWLNTHETSVRVESRIQGLFFQQTKKSNSLITYFLFLILVVLLTQNTRCPRTSRKSAVAAGDAEQVISYKRQGQEAKQLIFDTLLGDKMGENFQKWTKKKNK